MVVECWSVKLSGGRKLPHLLPPVRQQHLMIAPNEVCQFVGDIRHHLTFSVIEFVRRMAAERSTLRGVFSGIMGDIVRYDS